MSNDGEEAFFGKLLEKVPGMVGYWDHELRNRFANAAYVEWFGLTPAAIHGRHIRDVIGEQLFSMNEPYMRAALAGSAQLFERDIVDPKGVKRRSQARYIPDFQGERIAGFYVLVTDISELRNAQDALEVARAALESQKAELERSNRDLEQFAYAASHDLQEPLRAVSGCAQILERNYAGKLDGDADELIAHMVDGAARMRALIQDLLTYSRVGTHVVALRPVATKTIVQAALSNLGTAIAETGAVVEVGELPIVNADAAQLTQLFQNLLGNALKYRSVAAPQIQISARESDSEWVFSVKDNGIGIEPAYFERIFVLFQRLHTRNEYPGTGIGLALCQKIVERHGGRIWVESQLGDGSRFFFSLPK